MFFLPGEFVNLFTKPQENESLRAIKDEVQGSKREQVFPFL